MAFKDAYNKQTGQKLQDKVPEIFFDLFPNVLARTPRQADKDNRRSAPEADKKKKGAN